MGLISKTVTIACAGVGLASFSQLPEFTQQYRQHLTGAVEELRVVVTDFDRDAQSAGMSRTEALGQMVNSQEMFPKERGLSMTRTIDRFERLDYQKKRMEDIEPVSRPLFLFSTYDEKLLKGSWDIFEPAVPITVPGAVWGGFGAFLFGLLARIPIGLAGIAVNRVRRPRIINNKNIAGERQMIGGIVVTPAPVELQEADILPGKPKRLNRSTKASPETPSKTTSLLDQIVLEEGIVGEVDRYGRLVRPIKPGTKV